MNVYQIVLLVLAVIVLGLYIYKRVTGKDILRGIMLSRPVIMGLGAAVEAVANIWPERSELQTVRTIMKAAIEGLTRPDGTRPILLAVTQLTSTSEERMKTDLLINENIGDVVAHYANNAKIAGLDGVVCSPLEAKIVKDRCGAEFYTVTPGIRFADGDIGDQVRVTTPEKAKEIGSDYIVVGRPVTAAEDPVAAYRRCVSEFVG